MLLSSFLVLFFSSLVNFYFSIQILRYVSRADIKISFFELRWQVHKNMKAYKELCRNEFGRLGSAYYGYWLSLAVMIIAVLVMFYEMPWDSLA